MQLLYGSEEPYRAIIHTIGLDSYHRTGMICLGINEKN